jgi:hypothetical protein
LRIIYFNIINFQGICDAVIGPTLLDLRDIYETSIKTISFIVLFRALGSLVGTFLGEFTESCFKNYTTVGHLDVSALWLRLLILVISAPLELAMDLSCISQTRLKMLARD